MTTRGTGGRIPPDGRPAQAPGVGRNSKRHDLERPATPGLHDSDLQQGDVQAMEQGQRIAPRATMQRAQGQAPRSAGQQQQRRGGRGDGVQVPADPIEFLAKVNGPGFEPPSRQPKLANHSALNWLPIVRRMVTGPGSSGHLANTFINQVRNMQNLGSTPAAMINLGAVDDALKFMLDGAENDDTGV